MLSEMIGIIQDRYIFHIIFFFIIMIERIILNISGTDDDFIDVLFQTSALSSKRVIPMVNPTPSELADAMDKNTVIIRCYKTPVSRKQRGRGIDYGSRLIVVTSDCYLNDDGKVSPDRIDEVRMHTECYIHKLLQDKENVREHYLNHFDLLWKFREQIYTSPDYFFAQSGLSNRLMKSVPLGVMLKTIEENPSYFRSEAPSWSTWPDDRLIIDFQYDDRKKNGEWEWNTQTWCPGNNTVTYRLLQGSHPKEWNHLSRLVKKTFKKYDRNQGLSSLTVLDVLDLLSSSQAG